MIEQLKQSVYIVLGIDDNEHDQVLAVFREYESAKNYCVSCPLQGQFYDLWIEKHLVL